MVKVIEAAGIPVVQLCNLVPVSQSVGVNKIVPTISIPYPLGDPATPKEVQYNLRKKIVGTALDALTAQIEDQTVFSTK